MTQFLTNIFYKNECFKEPVSIETLARWTLTSNNLAEHKPAVKVNPSSNFVDRNAPKSSEPMYVADLPKKTKDYLENTLDGENSEESKSLIVLISELNLPPTTGNVIEKITWESPSAEDSLFWCVYLASQGDTSLLTPKTVAKEKSAVIDHVRAFPKCLKVSSEKTPLVSTNDILFNLLTNSETSPASLIALCVYYKIRATMIHFVGTSGEIAYVELDPVASGSEFPIFIIKFSPISKKYSIDLDTTADKLALIRETGIRMETICRPLSSASSYKVCELASIAARVGLVFEKKTAKSVMYEELARVCKWPAAMK